MYQALYRKYRPHLFRDVVGQEHITQVLSKEVSEGTFSHAYLFTGSRGIGKTTCAKILAKAVNCPNQKEGEPCCDCQLCHGVDDGSLLDVTEMDAASNRNIDDIRDLRNEANFTPALAKYRVYIIDEAHMLTKEAANALLKILEEPPEHVIFILATTEVNRLPNTILSRCMRFDFRRIPPEVIAERLKFVCRQEKIEIEDDAAFLIGKLADGGMRDALSLLDICRSSGEVVTSEVVSRCAGMAGKEYLYNLCDMVIARDVSKILGEVEKLYTESADVSRICDELIGHYRNLMIVSCTKDAGDILKVLPGELKHLKDQAEKLSQNDIFYAISVLQDTVVKMSKSTSKRLEFEMALMKLCTPSSSSSVESLMARIEKLEEEVKLLKAGKSCAYVSEKEVPTEPEMKKQEEKTEKVSDTADIPVMDTAENSTDEVPMKEWEDVLNLLSKTNGMCYSFLIDSRAFIVGKRVLIDSKNTAFAEFMKKSQDANSIIKDAITKVTGIRYGIGPYKKKEPDHSENNELSDLIDRVKNSGIENIKID